MNTRDFLFGLKPSLKEVKVGDQKIYVKEMTIGVRAKYESDLMNFSNGKSSNLEVRSNVVLHCVVDEEGTRVFKDKDIGEIRQMPSKVVTKIFDAILEISGLDNEELEEGKQE